MVIIFPATSYEHGTMISMLKVFVVAISVVAYISATYGTYIRVRLFRSLQRKCSIKKAVIKIFCNIQRKTSVLQSLFSKAAGLRHATLLKTTPWHQCFPETFCDCFWTLHLNLWDPGLAMRLWDDAFFLPLVL